MRLLPLTIVACVMGGCAGHADAPPEAEPAITIPDLADVSADVPDAVRAKIPKLTRDSGERQARRFTVRVRNISCDGVGTGSGFALAPDIPITNRHVLAGADELEVSTWDGHSLQVSFAQVGVLGDLGIAVVEGRLPATGRYGQSPVPGQTVTAVGYPLGGPLTLSAGTVVDRVGGDPFGIEGTVMRLTALVLPGNSGGPVLDRQGRIVGIVYAIERATGFGLAVPVDTLRALVRAGGFEAVPPCGYE